MINLSAIESRYIAAGYQLPKDWTWGDVHHKRKANGLADYAVPLCDASGRIIRWGVFAA